MLNLINLLPFYFSLTSDSDFMAHPLLLGHRGARASRHIPENTMASFELCLEHGCDGFEFDVRRSQDGMAVICHDPTVGKLQIEHSSSKALGLPALEQVLQQFSSRAFLDIELKVAGLEEQLIEALREYSPQKGYVVSSFLPEALAAVHQLDDTVPLGFIWDGKEKMFPACLTSFAGWSLMSHSSAGNWSRRYMLRRGRLWFGR